VCYREIKDAQLKYSSSTAHINVVDATWHQGKQGKTQTENTTAAEVATHPPGVKGPV
jgi:hypothetical protein